VYGDCDKVAYNIEKVDIICSKHVGIGMTEIENPKRFTLDHQWDREKAADLNLTVGLRGKKGRITGRVGNCVFLLRTFSVIFSFISIRVISSTSLRNPSSVAVLLRRVDWNVGIMERWNAGLWGNGKVGYLSRAPRP
jgi:hypothetical protein